MPKQKRKRGRVLTNSGLKKINEAIEEWKEREQLRGTLAEIEAISGVSSDTISKIRQGRDGSDLSKIQQLFAAFGIPLMKADHRPVADDPTLPQHHAQTHVTSLSPTGLSQNLAHAQGGHRIFISHDTKEPDLSLAQQFNQALSAAGHEVFMASKNIQLGENWAQRIDSELRQCNYLLLLLSSHSATSETIAEEVRRAKELRDSPYDGLRAILPIRVKLPLDAPLNYNLWGYLNWIQQREWHSEEDTPHLLQEVLELLAEEEDTTEEEDPETSAPTYHWLAAREASLRDIDRPLPAAAPELPGGQVELTSKLYVDRPPIEERCYETICRPGALIRIKAPRQMGKTSLMARTLHQASRQGCRTVPLSFQLAERRVFQDLPTFLRWFCVSTARRLRLANRLNDYWDDIFGSKDNCTAYFEEYLLESIESPIVLGLDEVDYVFSYPEIASDFFGLLRAWHEEAKVRDIWKKLRLLVVHSTEVYIPLDIHQSPFNVGLPVELPEFTFDQVQDLVMRHQLHLRDREIQQLVDLVGGHPFLVRLALYHLVRQDVTLTQLIEEAPTEAGLYSDHLRRHWWNLQQHPELAAAMHTTVTADRPVQLALGHMFKLNSMGLVTLAGNQVKPFCELYRRYFSIHLP